MANTQDEILEVIRELPDISVAQIAEYVSHVHRSVVAYHLNRMLRQGLVVRRAANLPNGKGGGQYLYSLNPEGKPSVLPLKLVKPMERGLQARLDDALARVREPETWKVEAIARFPDLGVDPEILQARKIAAGVLRRKGDNSAAADILAGRRDNSAIMEATLAALELGVEA